MTEDEVDWHTLTLTKPLGWNAKPTVLLDVLTNTKQALWIDSDIVIANGLPELVTKRSDLLVVGQEFRGRVDEGGRLRAQAWKLPLGRLLPFHVNSGTVLVSQQHQPLLKDWERLLLHPSYVEEQRLPVCERAMHLVGDQDVLWALLCSAPYRDYEVGYFRSGIDVIQDGGFNGYNWRDRFRDGGCPRASFVHALGWRKPWHDLSEKSPLQQIRGELERAFSTYNSIARNYRPDLLWTDSNARLTRTLISFCCNRRWVGGLALASLTAMYQSVARRLHRG